jgi:hypothetical protein
MRTRRSPSLPEDEENDGHEHDKNGNDRRHQLNDSSPDSSRARPPQIPPPAPPPQPLLQRMPPSLHARKGSSLDTASMNETTIRTGETASLLPPRSRTTTTTAPSSLPQSPARGSPTVPLAGTANVNDTIAQEHPVAAAAAAGTINASKMRNATTTTANPDWILHVRLPPWHPQVRQSLSKDDMDDGSIRKIHMPGRGGMTADQLEACLHQVVFGAMVPNDDAAENWPNSQPQRQQRTMTRIVGLYCEGTGTFVSVPYLVSITQRHDQMLVYAVAWEPPPPPPPTPRKNTVAFLWNRLQPWCAHTVIKLLATIWARGLIPITVLWIVYAHSDKTAAAIWRTGELLYDRLVELPLRDVYQYGPWFLGGWEGLDASAICARATLYGDAAFWSTHLDDCREIYHRRRLAWYLVARPILLGAWFLVVLWTLRWALWLWQVYQRIRSPLDRDMAEVYQAVHVIARQFHRNPPP